MLIPIILAAGASQRMGQAKFFLPVGAETLLRRALRAATALGSPVVIVTGPADREIREHLADWPGLEFAFNAAAATGMGSSIAVGIRAALGYGPRGFLVMLADQPGMDAAALGRHAAAFADNPDRIIATQYPQRAGVPAVFPARYAEQLLALNGAEGAQSLIAAAGPEVLGITFARPPEDIDTPEDYARYLEDNL
ncbi:nucleotidyltransferase family protein [Neolewinella lacunae]|nr:nucleotidyltransferase family protein [Neolewinella lacunae]